MISIPILLEKQNFSSNSLYLYLVIKNAFFPLAPTHCSLWCPRCLTNHSKWRKNINPANICFAKYTPTTI